jgi:hypothetical protein
VGTKDVSHAYETVADNRSKKIKQYFKMRWRISAIKCKRFVVSHGWKRARRQTRNKTAAAVRRVSSRKKCRLMAAVVRMNVTIVAGVRLVGMLSVGLKDLCGCCTIGGGLWGGGGVQEEGGR